MTSWKRGMTARLLPPALKAGHVGEVQRVRQEYGMVLVEVDIGTTHTDLYLCPPPLLEKATGPKVAQNGTGKEPIEDGS